MARDLQTMKGAGQSVQSDKKDFPALLKAYLPEIQRALPAHMNADRMARIALTEFRKNPKLAECDPRSVFAAIITASQLGLEPGVMGQAYLVPYRRECQLIPGWQGYVDMVSRSGRASVWTGAVFEGDELDWSMGDKQYVVHRPGKYHGIGKLTHVYAVGRIKGAEWPVVEVWTVDRVIAHRDRYNQVGERHYSYRDEHNFEMYGRKVALLQVIKYMPKSIELQRALELDLAGEHGKQRHTIQEAIEGTWSYVPDDDQPQAAQPQQAAMPEPESQPEQRPTRQQKEFVPGADDDDGFGTQRNTGGFE
jgi:recombination protein RecT